MTTRTDRWTDWVERTLLADIRSADTPDPVPVFESIDEEVETTDAFDQYRYGRGSGEYLYLLYSLDQPMTGPSDVSPIYIGETNDITSRLLQHFNNISDALPIAEWTDDESWGSWSKYDHMAAVSEQATDPLYVWILDVETLDTCPYGVPTYRQELEAKLVGLVHSLTQFERSFANREFVPNQVVHEMGKVGPEWLSGGASKYEPMSPTEQSETELEGKTKTDLWHEWVSDVLLADIHSTTEADPIPLFETDENLQIQLTEKGGLKRSEAIDARIRREGKKCVHETGVTEEGPDGLLYVLYQLGSHENQIDATDVIPRYIGKAEAYGKKNELSANFTEIAKERDATRSFARWGDGDYWHTGELSNTVFGTGNKKTAWATELFEQGTRQLSEQTYLWIRAWDPDRYRGPYGYDAYLAEAEPLLIGLAYDTYPESLLNHSGVPDDAPVKLTEHQFDPITDE